MKINSEIGFPENVSNYESPSTEDFRNRALEIVNIDDNEEEPHIDTTERPEEEEKNKHPDERTKDPGAAGI